MSLQKHVGSLRPLARNAAATLLALQIGSAAAADVDFTRLLNAHTTPQDWLTHHGSYRAWHYSALEQINTDNVQQLKVAWMHLAGSAVHAFPLVADGVLYYMTSAGEVWALNGADGTRLWRYAAGATRTQGGAPANGLALASRYVVLTTDTEVIALDAKQGSLAWRQTLIDASKSKYRLGAPLAVKDKLIIGAHSAGNAACCGPIYAVNIANGAKLWQFDSIVPQAGLDANWGGGAYLPGSYDFDSNTIWIATAAPSPRHDWAGADWRANGARPGDNLFTSGVVVLNADSGKLVSYFQEVPHDVWGFDGASGEQIMFERGGKRYSLHPNKNGYVYVYERQAGEQVGALPPVLQPAHIWRISKYSNFVHTLDARTGAMSGRRDLPLGKHVNLCPSSDGAIAPGAGALNPRTGMYYKAAREWCSNIELTQLAAAKVTEAAEVVAAAGSSQTDAQPLPEQAPQLGVTWQLTDPPPQRNLLGETLARRAFGHVSGRDPLTGAIMWEREYAQPPSASLLTTAGNLLFVPHADGKFEALDARNGKTLWSHTNGHAHDGGVISYAVDGKQYVAVVTGWAGASAGSYARLWGEPYASMPQDVGQLIVFALP